MGFFHHRWVTAKFVLTVVGLYLGVFVLSTGMDDAVASVRAGDGHEAAALAAIAAAMAGGLAFQVWLSVAKPGGRTRRSTRPAAAPAPVVAVAVLAPPADIALGIVIGNPVPVVSLGVLAAVVLLRRLSGGRPDAGSGDQGATPVAAPAIGR